MSIDKRLIDYPNLVLEWDKIKNADIEIEDFSYGSNKKVWWKCINGHSWQAVIANRTLKDNGCNECVANSQKQRLSSYPNLVKEFNIDLNSVSPESIRKSERMMLVWNCPKGHMWKDSAKNRINNNAQCLVCKNPKNFLISYQNFMEEWDYEENRNVIPDFLTVGSAKIKYSWKCSTCQNKWKANINNRVRKNTGCPKCHKSKHKSKQMDKSLLKYGSVYSDENLIAEWNYEKNSINPCNISKKSIEKVWWKCAKDHEWMAQINLRFNRKHECPYCSAEKYANQHHLASIESGDSLSFFDVAPEELKQEWDDSKYDPKKVLPYSHKKIQWKCLDKGHVWKATAGNRLIGGGCPECWASSFVSKGEKELSDYIESIYEGKIITSSRKIIYPYELDIYLPDTNIAFEFNGIYWHRENMLSQRLSDPNNYHYDKWKKCKDQGIQLITIWEDDWKDNKYLIKKMISHKLNSSYSNKIYARKTILKEVSVKDSRIFLNNHHIQGYSNGFLNIGLYNKDNNDELVSVAIFKRDKNKLNLVRYATSCSVVGGFSKIIKYVEKMYSSFDSIYTFADHEVSDGGLYEKNGFVVDSYLRPDYKYIHNGVRQHKFLFRKKRFEKDPNLLFDPNMTERELADLNRINRVWDSGKTKYMRNIC